MTEPMTDLKSDLRARAEKGLAWLKESGPLYDLDWRRVDLTRVVMENADLCILGQASSLPCRDFYKVLRDVALDVGVGEDEIIAWSERLGFDLDYYENNGFSVLTQVWQELLAEEHGRLTVGS